MKRKKLTKKQVRAYEKMSGLKTDGIVCSYTADNAVFEAYLSLFTPKRET